MPSLFSSVMIASIRMVRQGGSATSGLGQRIKIKKSKYLRTAGTYGTGFSSCQVQGALGLKDLVLATLKLGQNYQAIT